jgi:hypothetical protein
MVKNFKNNQGEEVIEENEDIRPTNPPGTKE